MSLPPPAQARRQSLALSIQRTGRVFVPEWEGNRECEPGEQIRCKYKTLSMDDMLEAQRTADVNLFKGLDVNMADRESIERQWGLIKHVVGKYTSDWEGVTVDGVPVTDGGPVTEALQANHLELLSEVFGKVLTDSTGQEDEAKNSESESEVASADSDSPAEPVSSPDAE